MWFYVVVFVCCLLLITLDGKDLVTNFTAVTATLNNIGPGLGEVGPMSTFASFSPFSKLVFSFAMLAGRLELLPILLLFVVQMWKGNAKISRKQYEKAENKNMKSRA